jgi:hypothetical protein
VLLRVGPSVEPAHQLRACMSAAVIAIAILYWVQSNPSYFGITAFLALAVYAGLAGRGGSPFDPLTAARETGNVAPSTAVRDAADA